MLCTNMECPIWIGFGSAGVSKSSYSGFLASTLYWLWHCECHRVCHRATIPFFTASLPHHGPPPNTPAPSFSSLSLSLVPSLLLTARCLAGGGHGPPLEGLDGRSRHARAGGRVQRLLPSDPSSIRLAGQRRHTIPRDGGSYLHGRGREGLLQARKACPCRGGRKTWEAEGIVEEERERGEGRGQPVTFILIDSNGLSLWGMGDAEPFLPLGCLVTRDDCCVVSTRLFSLLRHAAAPLRDARAAAAPPRASARARLRQPQPASRPACGRMPRARDACHVP